MASGKVRPQETKAGDDLSEVAMAEIKAEVQKSEQRLIFSGVVLILAAVCFIVRTCATHPAPPPREDDSVLCVKAGGRWHVATRDKDGHDIDAFCSRD